MHMSDALVSPVVAVTFGALSLTMLGVAAKKVKNSDNGYSTALMGVMGAFVFTAQMLNFSIPGTGSSGHIVGGILLASVLGPWASFITLSSVVAIQALFFADGGLLALGCNIFNIAFCSCLVAYPLVYKNIASGRFSFARVMWAAVLACVFGLELGALAVTIETELSGVTALPIGRFLLFMLPIHFAIGIVEGLATGTTLFFLFKYKPELQKQIVPSQKSSTFWRSGRIVAFFVAGFLILGGFLSWFASKSPDGLEWSVAKTSGAAQEKVSSTNRIYTYAKDIQDKSSFFPDYSLKKDSATGSTERRGETSVAGITGAIIVVAIAFIIGYFLRPKTKRPQV